MDSKDKDAKGKVNIDDVVEHTSELTFDDRVIKKVAGMAASEIPGILAMSGNFITGLADRFLNSDDPTKGINVEVGKKQVAIDMKVVCEYGRNIPVLFQNIQDKVTDVVKEMTGLDVVELNVHVYDVLTKEEFENQNRKKAEPKNADVKPEEETSAPRRVE